MAEYADEFAPGGHFETLEHMNDPLISMLRERADTAEARLAEAEHVLGYLLDAEARLRDALRAGRLIGAEIDYLYSQAEKARRYIAAQEDSRAG